MDIDTYLAQRVRELRRARGLTLEQLGERSGVSRSTISQIERQQTSPTAAVLNKLADALGLSLAALFAGAAGAQAPEPLARRADQPVWTDPASGYTRRQLSPPGQASALELLELGFPAGARVVFEPPQQQASQAQQLWLLEGRMHIGLDEQHWELSAGDCLTLAPGRHRISYHNPGPQAARYLLALGRQADISQAFA